jgi:hypothetical protein
MRGLPRRYNTKQDYFLTAALGAAAKQAAKAALVDLMDGRMIRQQTEELADAEDGTTDATHRVVVQQDESGDTVYLQLAYVVDEYSAFARQGWTDSEAAAFLAA